MAPQSKKKSKPSSRKKIPAKRKTKKKSRKGSTLKKDIFIVLGLSLIISLTFFAYILGQSENEKVVLKSKISKPVVKKEIKQKVVEKAVPKRKQKYSEVGAKTVPSKKQVITLGKNTKKPKLVIIIDDVHTRAQLSAIQELKLKVTPSIFPPYKISPNSHRLAQGLKHYMIHLPMESRNTQFNTQYKTLKVSFSNKKIVNRVKELRILFPTAKYINNHTGSVFTSDYPSMHFLYKIMKDNGFVFVDSRTVNSTKVREIAHGFGDVYVARDIFIDNEHTVSYIHKQLKKAVSLAKKKGYAVAIGHPHTVTMQALVSAKDIFKEVELVYIDGIYK